MLGERGAPDSSAYCLTEWELTPTPTAHASLPCPNWTKFSTRCHLHLREQCARPGTPKGRGPELARSRHAAGPNLPRAWMLCVNLLPTCILWSPPVYCLISRKGQVAKGTRQRAL